MKTKNTISRSPGRPAQVQAANIREQLLDAAVILFAEQGVTATPTRAIASRSGVTPAMVQYYFKNREKLLDAVFDERIVRFMEKIFVDLPADNESIQGYIKVIVDRFFNATEQMPWAPPIWIRDMVNESGALRSRLFDFLHGHLSQPRSSSLAGAPADIIKRFQLAQQRGELSPGVESGLAFISILGTTMFVLATWKLWSSLPGMDQIGREQARIHALAVLTQGLVPTPNKSQEKKEDEI